MAFPIIASSSVTTDIDNTTTVVTMPAGIVAGDLLVVFASNDNGAILSASAGWTLLASGVNGASNVSLAVFGKIAAGSDTCTLTDLAVDTAVVAVRVTDHGVVEPLPDGIVVGTSAIGTSATPNPPNCNPLVTRDYLWLETFAMEDMNPTATYWSSGFLAANQVATGTGGGGTTGIAVAQQNLAASSLDPGTMAASASKRWVAQTLAIKPVIDTSLQATITVTGSVVGALTTQIPLNTSIVESVTVSAALTTQIAVAGIASAISTVQANLTTLVALMGAISTQALVTAALTTQIDLKGVGSGSALLTIGELSTTGTVLEGAILVTAFVAGQLFTAITIVSDSIGTVTVLLGELTFNGPPGVSNERLTIPETLFPVLRTP